MKRIILKIRQKLLNPVLKELSVIRELFERTDEKNQIVFNEINNIKNFIKEMKKNDFNEICESILGRALTDNELDKKKSVIFNNTKSIYLVLTEMFLGREGFKNTLKNIIDVHLYYMHLARIKMIIKFVPEAKNILDIGGANGSLYDMGYPYKFDKITILDLPPEGRCEMYKRIKMKERKIEFIGGEGNIDFMYGFSTELSDFEDNSIDLVWLGQVVEHMERNEALKMYKEAKRILKPNGYFCLDTPNRFLTEIHTKGFGDGYVHPEHKIEYYPDDLKQDLMDSGFVIDLSIGVCHMPESFHSKCFNYNDFLFGNLFSDNICESYIQFYRCTLRS